MVETGALRELEAHLLLHLGFVDWVGFLRQKVQVRPLYFDEIFIFSESSESTRVLPKVDGCLVAVVLFRRFAQFVLVLRLNGHFDDFLPHLVPL